MSKMCKSLVYGVYKNSRHLLMLLVSVKNVSFGLIKALYHFH